MIGNPIEHSLSPQIHSQFATQTGISLEYSKHLLEESQLNDFVANFFATGGLGLNVTSPFKQSILCCVSRLSDAAKVCNSVNTVSIGCDGKLVGDSTDGAGILLDLNQQKFEIVGQRVLVIGAGGATIPVVYALLKNRAKVTIHNRTKKKITNIIERLERYGDVSEYDSQETTLFDGVIVAMSGFNANMLDPVVAHLKKDAFIYDLNYAARAQETLDYFAEKGFVRSTDGYGMLVGQAAKSFEIWHGVMPSLTLKN